MMQRGVRLADVLAYTAATEPGTAPVLSVDLGGGDRAEVEWFGSDSPPATGDVVLVLEHTRSGELVAIGANDGAVTQSAQGERRWYARDASGVVMATLWLRGDGSIEMSNAAGSIKLGADGTVAINGATIDALGNLAATSVAGTSADLDAHTHTAPPGGGTTTPPDPAP